jgi:excisionase family DNA binding protein
MLKAAEEMIIACVDHARAASLTVDQEDGSSPRVQVPVQILRELGQLLGRMARHQPIALAPERQELSTVQAANFLNVSRPFLIKEIQDGKLAHRMVGTHRRIEFSDLMAYANSMRAKRPQAPDKERDPSGKRALEY